MPEMFKEAPNVVHVIIEDDTAKAERYVTGLDVETVVAKVTEVLTGAAAVEKRARKKRAVKVEKPEAPEPTPNAVKKDVPAWPQGDTKPAYDKGL